uniref:Abnormal cell migration protein 18-like fibronectin type I domain-containing protein n=2 Tax=Meloidogyne TaxID=189290 RepID=A0A914LVD0_MELIC
MLVLVPLGEDPKTAKNRIIIPQVKGNHRLAVLPCLIAGLGIYEHGKTFTKGNFHYNCKNGTAEVIACVSDDMSVIQIGRTFLKEGIRHRCEVKGQTVTYEQKSTCYENGIHYDIGETFKNGSFQLICKENGVAVKEAVILLGESRIISDRRHSCELTENGKIRYVINFIGCFNSNGSAEYKPGQIWTEKHIRYQCSREGMTKVLGCVDGNGLFIELGHDVLMGGTVHRCYRIKNTTFYHRFQCQKDFSLTECVHANFLPTQEPQSEKSEINVVELKNSK